MKTYLIEPCYKISDGTAHNRSKARCSSNSEMEELRLIEADYTKVVENHLFQEKGYHLEKCRLRWFGVWNDKVEIGYEGINPEDGKPVIGKLFLDNPDTLSKKLEKILN